MSRSGYNEDLDNWTLVRWRGAVSKAIKGKRGQAFLKEMLTALESMEEGRLIAGDLCKNGDVCAIGSVGVKRGMDMTDIDKDDPEEVAARFGISRALAAEIEFENDDTWYNGKETPEGRYSRMLFWVKSQIIT